MKKQLFTMATWSIMILAACQPAPEQAAEQPADDAPDYAVFNEKVSVIRSFFAAHSDEDIEVMIEMLADTIQWSPPYYNGNEWLGKEDFVAAVGGYHDDFENIQFHEGIAGLTNANNASNGFWSGSVFPESTATINPEVIRIYGTWTATHSETGKEIGVKWYGLGWVNAAGQIARWSEYFDVHGMAAQIAEE